MFWGNNIMVWNRKMDSEIIELDDFITADEKLLLSTFRAMPESDRAALIGVISRNKYFNDLNERNNLARERYAASRI